MYGTQLTPTTTTTSWMDDLTNHIEKQSIVEELLIQRQQEQDQERAQVLQELANLKNTLNQTIYSVARMEAEKATLMQNSILQTNTFTTIQSYIAELGRRTSIILYGYDNDNENENDNDKIAFNMNDGMGMNDGMNDGTNDGMNEGTNGMNDDSELSLFKHSSSVMNILQSSILIDAKTQINTLEKNAMHRFKKNATILNLTKKKEQQFIEGLKRKHREHSITQKLQATECQNLNNRVQPLRQELLCLEANVQALLMQLSEITDGDVVVDENNEKDIDLNTKSYDEIKELNKKMKKKITQCQVKNTKLESTLRRERSTC